MKIRKICKYEFEDAHDMEFVPSESKAKVFEVWVNGVFIEEMPPGERASVARAWYYYEVHGKGLYEGAEAPSDPLDGPSNDPLLEAPSMH